jgi:hypothetical protein
MAASLVAGLVVDKSFVQSFGNKPVRVVADVAAQRSCGDAAPPALTYVKWLSRIADPSVKM